MLTTLFALVALVGLVTVGFAVRRLIQLAGRSVLCRVPLVAEQRVELPQPGPMVLYAEAPLAATFLRGNVYAAPPAFRGLDYSLAGADTGEAIALSNPLGAAVVSGLSTTRVPLARFSLERPGAVTLRVRNLTPSSETERCAFVFSRSQGATMILAILRVVAGGVLLVAGVVFTILSAAGAL